MKVIQVTGPSQHARKDLDIPTIGADFELIRPTFVGLCGTDLKLFSGQLHDADYPLVPGHEWVGTLRGDPVAGSNFSYCRGCDSCLQGMPELCPSLRENGFDRQGALAEVMALPKENVRRLPAGSTMIEFCLAEPLSVALHAVSKVPSNREHVAVIGGGAIGALTALALIARGHDVIVVEASEKRRRKLAEGWALATLDSLGDIPGTISTFVDATGNPAVLSQLLDVVPPASHITLVGYSGDSRADFQPSVIMLKQLTISGVLSGVLHYDAAFASIANGSVAVAPFIERNIFEFDQIDEALDALASGALRAFVRIS